MRFVNSVGAPTNLYLTILICTFHFVKCCEQRKCRCCSYGKDKSLVVSIKLGLLDQ